MERLTPRRRNIAALFALTTVVLVGCTIDSYATNPSDVHCDGTRTKTGLEGNGVVAFIVHGKANDALATIQVRRSDEGVSVSTSESITSPPQQQDGFTTPTPIPGVLELAVSAAGAAWVIDVRPKYVVIQGTC